MKKRFNLGKKDLEETIKEKVGPLLEESMERNWGIKIPQVESDITDQLTKAPLSIYIPPQTTFQKAKRAFKKEFFKRELQLHVGNISQLAKMLGLDRRSLHRAIKELDINMDEIRREESSKYKEVMIDQTIRDTLEQYKQIIQPQKMDLIYQDLSSLSRNIAKFLPSPDLTWKDAELEFEKQFLGQALKDNEGNVGKAAAEIKLRAETLHRKVKKLGLKKE